MIFLFLSKIWLPRLTVWSNPPHTIAGTSWLTPLFLSGSTSAYSACSSQRDLINYKSAHPTLLLKRFHQLPMILRINPRHALLQRETLHDLASLLRPLPPFLSMLQPRPGRPHSSQNASRSFSPEGLCMLGPLENPSTRTPSGSLPSLD